MSTQSSIFAKSRSNTKKKTYLNETQTMSTQSSSLRKVG